MTSDNNTLPCLIQHKGRRKTDPLTYAVKFRDNSGRLWRSIYTRQKEEADAWLEIARNKGWCASMYPVPMFESNGLIDTQGRQGNDLLPHRSPQQARLA